jgi:hypothetical protein
MQVKKAGPVTVRLKLNAAARRKLQRQKRLPVKLRLTFTPASGHAIKKTVRVTLRPQTKAPTCHASSAKRHHVICPKSGSVR